MKQGFGKLAWKPKNRGKLLQERRQRSGSKQEEGKTLYPIIQSTLRNAVDIVMFFEVQMFLRKIKERIYSNTLF